MRDRDPQDQRRSIVSATPRGRAPVRQLSTTIEAHDLSIENVLGKHKLAELYTLLDALIAMEGTRARRTRRARRNRRAAALHRCAQDTRALHQAAQHLEPQRLALAHGGV